MFDVSPLSLLQVNYRTHMGIMNVSDGFEPTDRMTLFAFDMFKRT